MDKINAALADLSSQIAAVLQAKDEQIAGLKSERDSLKEALGKALNEADVLAGIAAVGKQVAGVDTTPEPLPE